MKSILIYFAGLLLLFAFIVSESLAGNNSALLKQAHAAVKAKKLTRARNLFEKAVKQDQSDPAARYHLASTYLKLGNIGAGLRQLRQSLKLAPDNPGLHLSAGNLFSTHGQYQDALDAFGEVLRLDPGGTKANEASKRITLAMVNSHVAKGDLDSAIFLMGNYLEQYPKEQFAYFRLATIYARASKIKLAEKTYLKLIKINPNHLQARIQLALLYQFNGQIDKAQQHLNQVSKRDPTGKTGKQAGISLVLLRNNKLVKAGRLREAVDNFKKLHKDAPNNPVFIANIGQLSFRLNDFATARAAYQRLVKLTPNDALVHFRLGEIYFKMQQMGLAVAELEIVVKLNKDSKLGKEAAKNLRTLHRSTSKSKSTQPVQVDLKQRIKYLSAAIASNPDDLVALLERAELYYRYQQFVPAKQDLLKILAQKSHHVQALLKLGQVYEALDLTAEANIVYAKVNTLDRTGSAGQKAARLALNLGAKNLFKQGKYKAAAREFQGIVARNQSDATAHYFLALIYQQDNELDKTISEYQQVIRINPNNLMARYKIGLVYEQLNREDEAMRAYRSMVSKTKNSYFTALAKQRIATVENRVNGLSFRMDYAVSLDNNTNYGSDERRKIVTYDNEGIPTVSINGQPTVPISDLLTLLNVNTTYRFKKNDTLRYGIAAELRYNVFHKQEYDFITTSFSPFLQMGRYQRNWIYSYKNSNSNSLKNYAEEGQVTAKISDYRVDYLQRYRLASIVGLLTGQQNRAKISSTIRLFGFYRQYDSGAAAFDFRTLSVGMSVNQSIRPGLGTHMGISFADVGNLEAEGSDIAVRKLAVNLSMEKLVFGKIIANLNYVLTGVSSKNADIAILYFDSVNPIQRKRVVINNALNVRFTYRHRQKMTLVFGYSGQFNSSNLGTSTASSARYFFTPSLSTNFGDFVKSSFFLSVNLSLQ